MERGRRCAILPKGIAASRFSHPGDEHPGRRCSVICSVLSEDVSTRHSFAGVFGVLSVFMPEACELAFSCRKVCLLSSGAGDPHFLRPSACLRSALFCRKVCLRTVLIRRSIRRAPLFRIGSVFSLRAFRSGGAITLCAFRQSGAVACRARFRRSPAFVPLSSPGKRTSLSRALLSCMIFPFSASASPTNADFFVF